MAKLQTKHFFPFVRMVRALGGKSLLTEIMNVRKKASDKTEKGDGALASGVTEEVGVEIVGLLIDRLPDAENEVLDFLALFTGKSRQELDEQPIEETIASIKEIVTDPKFLDFFKSAAK